jgi:excinuclease ABC subunit C
MFMDGHDKVLYVGKAKVIRNRLAQHFHVDGLQDPRRRWVLEKIVRVEWLVTPTERDALLVENQYIKKFQPPFNWMLRDDKTFPYLRVTLTHAFPKLVLTRKVVASKDIYLGPFTSGLLVKEMIQLCQKLFKVRSCSDYFFRSTRRPCLAYQLGRCRAPCVGWESQAHYQSEIQRMIQFLAGKEHSLLRGLKSEMKRLSDREEFSAAKELRDQIFMIERFLRSQHAQFSGLEGHHDVMAVHLGRLGIMHIRFGVITGIRVIEPRQGSIELSDEEILVSGLSNYGVHLTVPNQILVPQSVKTPKNLGDLVFENTQQQCRIKHAAQPAEKRLMHNLLRYLSQPVKSSVVASSSVSAPAPSVPDVFAMSARENLLRDFFHLDWVPSHFECLDISHLQGDFMVGAVVVFNALGPLKSAYRTYKLKERRIDDPAAIHEVCLRRYGKMQAQGTLPHVIMVDGGKGQLNAAYRALQKLQLPERVCLCSIAKNRNQKYGGEKIYFLHPKKPLLLPPRHGLYSFLTQMRDEAHRFCNQYQRRKWARKVGSVEGLEALEGVGRKRAQQIKSLLIEGGPSGILGKTSPPKGIPWTVWKRIQDWLDNDQHE